MDFVAHMLCFCSAFTWKDWKWLVDDVILGNAFNAFKTPYLFAGINDYGFTCYQSIWVDFLQEMGSL